MKNKLTFICPSYRLDGWIELNQETPNGNAVRYHVDVFGYFQQTEYRSFPFHVKPHIQNYSETMRALLLAGF